MNDYYHVRFDLSPCTETECDVLSALLCDIGFESFVPDSKGVSAYIKQNAYDAELITNALAQYPFGAQISIVKELIEGQDWNKEWEKNYFQPIVFKDLCVIHSSFHQDYPSAKYDIVIDPKMAFGTGHHETTSLMIERILSQNMDGLKVLDMGTGTGILAILSAMHGAEEVVGVEIDPFAYDNASDNVNLNSCNSNVALRLGGAECVSESDYYDVVLANINRNIILEDIGVYAKALKTGGKMFLSGFYMNDVPLIETAAFEFSLSKMTVKEKNNWANICLEKC